MIDNTWATPLYFKALGARRRRRAPRRDQVHRRPLRPDDGRRRDREALHARLRAGMYDLGAYVSPDDCYQALRACARCRCGSSAIRRTRSSSRAGCRRGPRSSACSTLPCRTIPATRSGGAISAAPAACSACCCKPCPAAAWHALVDGLELFGLGASWGGYESLIMPNHPERYRTATPWDATLPEPPHPRRARGSGRSDRRPQGGLRAPHTGWRQADPSGSRSGVVEVAADPRAVPVVLQVPALDRDADRLGPEGAEALAAGAGARSDRRCRCCRPRAAARPSAWLAA